MGVAFQSSFYISGSLRILCAFCKAFVCNTIHRNLKEVHTLERRSEIICKTCTAPIGSKENEFLTRWYFNPRWRDTPTSLLFFIVGGLHLLFTRKEGKFEHPVVTAPEQGERYVGNELPHCA